MQLLNFASIYTFSFAAYGLKKMIMHMDLDIFNCRRSLAVVNEFPADVSCKVINDSVVSLFIFRRHANISIIEQLKKTTKSH